MALINKYSFVLKTQTLSKTNSIQNSESSSEQSNFEEEISN